MSWICACLSPSNKYKSVLDHKQIILSSLSISSLSVSSPVFVSFQRPKWFWSRCVGPSSPISSNGCVSLDDISNRASPRLQRPNPRTRSTAQPDHPHPVSIFEFLSQPPFQLLARNQVFRDTVNHRCYGPGATAKSTAPAPADDPSKHAHPYWSILPRSESRPHRWPSD